MRRKKILTGCIIIGLTAIAIWFILEVVETRQRAEQKKTGQETEAETEPDSTTDETDIIKDPYMQPDDRESVETDIIADPDTQPDGQTGAKQDTDSEQKPSGTPIELPFVPAG